MSFVGFGWLFSSSKKEVEAEVDGCQAKAHFANRINKAYQAHHKDGEWGQIKCPQISRSRRRCRREMRNALKRVDR